MKRLTNRNDIAVTIIKAIEDALVIRQISLKLKDYEDTGLEPEEIQKLKLSDASKEKSSIEYYNEMRKYQDALKYYEDLEEQLTQKLCELNNHSSNDGIETYTTGYRYGHRNGQIELLEQILHINDSKEEAERIDV